LMEMRGRLTDHPSVVRGKGYGVGMATSERSAKHAAALATYKRFLRDGVPGEEEG
jgi:hypothetical protein